MSRTCQVPVEDDGFEAEWGTERLQGVQHLSKLLRKELPSKEIAKDATKEEVLEMTPVTQPIW